jgi:endoglucanase
MAVICFAAGAAFSQTFPNAGGNVNVNSVGYVTNFPKKATVRVNSNETETAFTVKRASDNAVAFTGTLGNIINNTDTPDKVRIADFSAFNTEGRYYVEWNSELSPEFDIGPGALHEAYKVLMQGMYLWRCGCAVSATYKGQTYHHAECHLSDGQIGSGTSDGGVTSSGSKDGTGGWHDAGDYNKYITNSAFAVGMMMKAWEHNKATIQDVTLLNDVGATGGLPPYLAEIKWNLDWMAKMQFDDGSVSHKLTTVHFGDMIMPEAETATRYFVPWSTGATASFAGTFALAYRIYKDYDDAVAAGWLEQAKAAYDFMIDKSYQPHDPDDGTGMSTTGMYQESDEALNKIMYAAAELWEATGETQYLTKFEEIAASLQTSYGTEADSWNYDPFNISPAWSDLKPVAAGTYLASAKTGKNASLVTWLRDRLSARATEYETNAITLGYGRVLGDQEYRYSWGTNGNLAATAYTLNIATIVLGDQRYRAAGIAAVDHLLGRNYFGRSFVSGLGHNPPTKAHDRRRLSSGENGNPWPGYLAGGPNTEIFNSGSDGDILYQAACEYNGAVMPGICWQDKDDYSRSEIAINWNAALIYAVSGFLGSDLAAGDYHPGDVAVINALIDNNGLDWTRDAPASWPVLDNEGYLVPAGVVWNNESPARIVTLQLMDKNLTGTASFSGLEKLEELECTSTGLSGIDVSGNAELWFIQCGGNNLSALDVSNNTKLRTLWIQGNRLASLNLENNTELSSLWVNYNQLTSLNVAGLKLFELDVRGNPLTALDCSGNMLFSLDLSGLATLGTFNGSGQTFPTFELTRTGSGGSYTSTPFTLSVGFDVLPLNGLAAGISFDPDTKVFTSTDNTVASTTFSAATNLEGKTLSGTINFTYDPPATGVTTYTVTFDSDGGTAVASIENVASGATIAAPPAPTKDGYHFVAWY